MASQTLEIPERKDEGVLEAMKQLDAKLRTEQMKDYLGTSAYYLHIAANAAANDAKPLIKVQNCLFDMLKLCDAWNLMLTNFKLGSGDILEKLQIAYLYLLDGFPDNAMTDVESVQKNLNSMKEANKKAKDAFTGGQQRLGEALDPLTKSKDEFESVRLAQVLEYGNHLDQLKDVGRQYIDDQGKQGVKGTLEGVYRSLDDARDEVHDYCNILNDNQLAQEAVKLAQQPLKDGLKFLEGIEQEVESWCVECKEVVQKNMKVVIKMPEEEQKKLPFTEIASIYLCRWKALQEICASTLLHLKTVRRTIDGYYTENLYPSDAVLKAREDSKKDEHLKDFKPPYQVVVVCRDEFTLMKLLPMKSAEGDSKLEDQLKIVRDELSAVYGILPGDLTKELQPFQDALRNLRDLSQLVYEKSGDALIEGHCAVVHKADGIPLEGKIEFGNIPDLGRYEFKLPSIDGLSKEEGKVFDALKKNGAKKKQDEKSRTDVFFDTHPNMKMFVPNAVLDRISSKSKSEESSEKCKRLQLALHILPFCQDNLEKLDGELRKSCDEALKNIKETSGRLVHAVTSEDLGGSWVNKAKEEQERLGKIRTESAKQWKIINTFLPEDPYLESVLVEQTGKLATWSDVTAKVPRYAGEAQTIGRSVDEEVKKMQESKTKESENRGAPTDSGTKSENRGAPTDSGTKSENRGAQTGSGPKSEKYRGAPTGSGPESEKK